MNRPGFPGAVQSSANEPRTPSGPADHRIPAPFVILVTEPMNGSGAHHGPRDRGQEEIRWHIWSARMAARMAAPPCGP